MYYNPEKTIFGELKPSNAEILNLYLYENSTPIAYITGTSLYNQLGLTTQVPKIVKIASFRKEIRFDKDTLVIKSTKSYAPISRDTIPLLQVLDVAKDFKRIPDANRTVILNYLKKKIKEFSKKELREFVTLAGKYPVKVTALIGAILESLNFNAQSETLKYRINALSRYSFGITQNQLKTVKNWNII